MLDLFYLPVCLGGAFGSSGAFLVFMTIYDPTKLMWTMGRSVFEFGPELHTLGWYNYFWVSKVQERACGVFGCWWWTTTTTCFTVDALTYYLTGRETLDWLHELGYVNRGDYSAKTYFACLVSYRRGAPPFSNDFTVAFIHIISDTYKFLSYYLS